MNITTTGSFGELVYDLVQAGSIDDIRNAIEQDGKVITGVIGGHGVFDSAFVAEKDTVDFVANWWKVGDIAEELWQTNTGSDLGGTISGIKNLSIGSKESEPVILGAIGSDFVL